MRCRSTHSSRSGDCLSPNAGSVATLACVEMPFSRLTLADTENPYQPPTSSPALSPVDGGPLRVTVYAIGSAGLAVLGWAILLLLFFADSSEIWPGFVCGLIAIVGCGALAYGLTRLRLRTRTLLLFYTALDMALFIFFIGYNLWLAIGD